eukprot:4260147-Amphidinium_carterae.3
MAIQALSALDASIISVIHQAVLALGQINFRSRNLDRLTLDKRKRLFSSPSPESQAIQAPKAVDFQQSVFSQAVLKPRLSCTSSFSTTTSTNTNNMTHTRHADSLD